jgi:predicted kinase
MKVNSFIQHLSEGLYDPGIFKAFFLAGGPGSGKTFVTSSAFAGSGLKLVNSDIAFERGLKKANLSLSMPDEETYFRNIIRNRAKAITITQLDKYVDGRLGLVIDSTGRDYDMIARHHNMLQQMGYDCYMVFVNTSLEVALARNARRERTIPEYITTSSWNGVQSNMGKFQRLFGMSNFIVVDNNKSDLELTTLTMNRVSKVVRKFITTPVSNYRAKQWMKKELEARKRI